MVLALHDLLDAPHHIIAQIIETKLVIGTIGDIGPVGTHTLGAVRPVLVDTIDGQQQKFKNRSYPLTIPARQVIVDSYHMHPLTRQAIEISRQGSHQRFTLTRSHFGNFTVVQHHTTDQLHIVVDHIPHDLSARSIPAVLPDSLITFDTHIRLTRPCRQFPVMLHCRHAYDRILGEAARRFLDHCEGLRQQFTEDNLQLLIALLFELIDGGENILFFGQIFCCDSLIVQLIDFFIDFGQMLCYTSAKIEGQAAEFVMAQGAITGSKLINFFDDGRIASHVSVLFAAKNFLE